MQMNSHVKEVKTAIKRCKAMAINHEFETSFNSHELAACLENHTDIIYVEIKQCNPDYLFILECVYVMAKKINNYCDKNKVKSDKSAEYWLSAFLNRHNFVCNFDCLA
jgi:hypothetical protein